MATTGTSRNGPSTSSRDADSDFETAIAACGVGCFNVCLVIASITTAISVIFTTSSISFIFPAAECDLHLSLMDKGYLNAMSFAGMISSTVLWGYIADTRGRKVVLVYALILDGIVVVCSGLSQTLTQLLVFKFFDGFLICGPYAVIVSYVSEFHGRQHRARIMMILGMNFSAASMILPLLAILILPYQMSMKTVISNLFTWHVFLLATAIVPFFGGICNIFFPESPKFLMSQGRNEEAMECLRTIYSINQRKPKSEYPIKSLLIEAPLKHQQHLERSSVEYKATHNTIADKRQLAKQQFIEGLQQLRPMFSNPYLKQSIQIYTMFFSIFLGLNSLRLWLPQIFATLEELEAKKKGSSSMCTILEYNYNKTLILTSDGKDFHCDLEHLNINSYIDNLYLAIVTFLCYFLVTIVINKMGSNLVLKIFLCLGIFSSIAIYFSNSPLTILISSSIYVSVVCVAASTVILATVNLFPTKIRTMMIIIMMTFGRFGSLLGNLLFPLLVSIECLPPFLLIAVILTVSFALSLFLPNTNQIALI